MQIARITVRIDIGQEETTTKLSPRIAQMYAGVWTRVGICNVDGDIESYISCLVAGFLQQM